jgi:hypothetical protein
MDSLKEESIKAISKLSNDTDTDEIIYRLYIIDKVRKGKEAVLKGKTISLEDLKRQIKEW